jgi:thymidylate kinase
VILLDLPAEQARELIARKARRDYTAAEVDLQEADTDYQRRVRDLYRTLAEADPAWRRVPVADAAGELRSVAAVAADVRLAASGA